MVEEDTLSGFATRETPRYNLKKNWFMLILRVKRVIEARGKFKPTREKCVNKGLCPVDGCPFHFVNYIANYVHSLRASSQLPITLPYPL